MRTNADWLFKCVGAAHAVLADPKARRELDADLSAGAFPARGPRSSGGGGGGWYQSARCARLSGTGLATLFQCQSAI